MFGTHISKAIAEGSHNDLVLKTWTTDAECH